MDPKLYDAYVGQYEFAPNFTITISREGDGLYAQATGQGKFEVFPEAKTKFFYKVVDAHIVFNLSEAGVVESLTLYQGMPAKRVK